MKDYWDNRCLNIPNIILLAQTKESSDLGGSLRTKTLGIDHISETWNIALALLDDGESQDGEILTNDAATDGLAFAFTSAARSVAGVALGEEELDASGEHL